MPPETLDKWDRLPGLHLAILGVSGGTGPNGALRAADTIAVRFQITADAGCVVPIDALDGASVWFSGPTSNYQHVLPAGRERSAYSDVASKAVANGDGTYTYTFVDPIPAAYGPPLNDTTKFKDGELTGQALLDGTYSVAMRAFRNYTVQGNGTVDAGEDLRDVLFGAATKLEPREVVRIENCNRCHVAMQRHGGTTRDTRLCVTCHTAGAEDGNSTEQDDPTNETIEMQVMIHRIHSGRHLPSVIGIATKPDGSRDYAAKPRPFVLGAAEIDRSWVGFPSSPAAFFPMPRDVGYSALGAAEKAKEDLVRKGVVDCWRCHGDPDGAGPLPAPAQGDLHEQKPTRRPCGSCHDDVDWSRPYSANQMKHTAQADDSSCALAGCHPAAGTEIAVRDAHVHPLQNAALNPGINVAIASLSEAGASDGDGKIDPGEKISVSFTIKDDAGNDLPAASIATLGLVVTGPTVNRNPVLVVSSFPLAALPAGPTYKLLLPGPITLEYVGTASDDAKIEAFSTWRKPHWNVAGALTTVLERTATGGGTTTVATAATPQQVVLDVASDAGFAHDDYVVIDDEVPGAKEFAQITLAEGQRIWVKPPLKRAHAAGATIKEVTLVAKATPADFAVNAAAGTITEASAASIGAGHDLVASYTSDFVMPTVYPAAQNDSGDLDERSGKWAGKSIVPGTYTFGAWATRNVVANPGWAGDATSYRGGSPPASVDFLVGGATQIVPWSSVSSGTGCNDCHADLMGHNVRRGVETCLLCHGGAGDEDKPRASAANAPATPGVSLDFRFFAHKVHMGRNLPDAASFEFVSGAGAPWPDNYEVATFDHIQFPVKPDGTKHCEKCHAENDTWKKPRDRAHPTEQGAPVRAWRASCAGCHSSPAAGAHIESLTPGGVEACEVCHGPGRDMATEVSHTSY
jgi:hypothetical protein